MAPRIRRIPWQQNPLISGGDIDVSGMPEHLQSAMVAQQQFQEGPPVYYGEPEPDEYEGIRRAIEEADVGLTGAPGDVVGEPRVEVAPGVEVPKALLSPRVAKEPAAPEEERGAAIRRELGGGEELFSAKMERAAAPSQRVRVGGPGGPRPTRRRTLLPKHLQGEYGKYSPQGRYYGEDVIPKLAAQIEGIEGEYGAAKEKLETQMFDGDITPSEYQTKLDALKLEATAKKRLLTGQLAEVSSGKKKAEAVQGTAVMRGEGEMVQQELKGQAVQQAVQATEYEKASKLAKDWEEDQARQTKAAELRVNSQDTAMAALREKMDKSDKLVRDFRIEDKRPAGQRFMQAIAVALGAFGAGLTGTSNDALKIVMGQIDDHMEGQSAQFEALREQGKLARNDYAAYHSQFQDKEQAQLALKARYLDEYLTSLDAVASETKGTRAKALVVDLMDKVGMVKDQTELRIENVAAVNEANKIAQVDAARAAALRARAKQALRSPGRGAGGATVEITRATHQSYMPQYGGYIGISGEAAKTVKRDLGFVQAARGMAREMIRIIRHSDAQSIPWSKTKARLDALHWPLRNMVGQATGSGVVNDSEEDAANKTVPLVTRWYDRDEANIAALETLDGLLANIETKQVEAFNIRPGWPEPEGTDPKTNEVIYRAHLLNPTPTEQSEREAAAYKRAGIKPPGQASFEE